MMKLYYAPQSPFARKVRAAAIELGLESRIELEYVEVIPGRPNRDLAKDRTPLRKIPALLTADHGTLVDSTVICEYLDELSGGGVLIPRETTLRWRTLTSHSIAQGMCESAISIRYETWLRPADLRWQPWIEDQWDKIFCGLAWFENNPRDLQGPVTIAHLALGSLLGYVDFRWPNQGWRERHSRLSSWFATIAERPSFARTVPSAAVSASRPPT